MSSQGIMLRQLAKNQNSEILKEVISKATKVVQQRVYWLTTCQDEGAFLQQYWQKEVNVNSIMKNRIAKITQQKFDQVFAQINKGKHTSSHGLEVFHIGNLNLQAIAQEMPVYNHNYFSQDHPKTKQTQAKIKQIQQDYQKFKSKIQEIKRKQRQKKLEKDFMEEEMRKSMEKEKKEKYREYVTKSIETKTIEQQQRKKQNQKFKQFLKVYKGSKPLYALMEQEYKYKIELPMLEQNKKKLQELKHKAKPTLQQINQHQLNYLRQKQDRPSRIYIANKTIDVSFKSKFYKEEQKKFNGDDEGYETVFDQVQKKKRYSQLVKQHFKPKISNRLRNSINQSQLKSTIVKESLDRQATYEKGNDYLQFVRSLQKKRKQHSSPSQRGDQQQQQRKAQRYANYLQQLKTSRQVQQGNQSRIQNQWERDIKNKSLSEHQRRERILMKSKQLEEKAQRQQQYVSHYHFGRAAEVLQKKKQIDDTLISSIRAKVAVLKQAHEL